MWFLPSFTQIRNLLKNRLKFDQHSEPMAKVKKILFQLVHRDEIPLSPMYFVSIQQSSPRVKAAITCLAVCALVTSAQLKAMIIVSNSFHGKPYPYDDDFETPPYASKAPCQNC